MLVFESFHFFEGSFLLTRSLCDVSLVHIYLYACVVLFLPIMTDI